MDNDNITLRNFVQLQYKTIGGPVYFVGKTEDEARAELDKWLNWKRDRSVPVDINVLPLKDTGFRKETLQVASAAAPEASSGKGQSLVGKIWMIHHKDKARARVAPVEVAAYEKQGYERGGPKTKFRG